jgi:hypothetical protein
MKHARWQEKCADGTRMAQHAVKMLCSFVVRKSRLLTAMVHQRISALLLHFSGAPLARSPLPA